ncbi:MAG: ATP-binding protein [Proteobacteria bacterium]|nr:ATP-binding protein [Pseudomonadota bacterium]
MIVSIASGKGGTGKTTIATNLAISLERDVQLMDCDVEEPNAHLFIYPEIEKSLAVSVLVPKVDLKKCNFCKKCMDICQFNAITVVKSNVLTFPLLCHSCDGCRIVCPEQAIDMTEREIGMIDMGRKDHMVFLNGRLNIGEAMAPPLIRSVKTHIRKDMPVIIDAPPGTSCPVIAAMKDTDFVLLVTEPTPFGLHDLKLAVSAIKILDIPCGLVINRSDIGDDKVRAFADQEGVPILMEIPFDRRIAESYAIGEPFVNRMPEWKSKFVQLYKDIETKVNGREKKGA